MNKVKRDVFLVSLRQRKIQLALCVLFLPKGYSISATDHPRRERLAVATEKDETKGA